MSDTITAKAPNPDKVAIVEDVRERLENSEAILFTEYRGLNVSELAELRTALKAAGGTYKIYKNTLAKIAARELDLDIEEFLSGPTAITFVDGDIATAAKALDNYSKDHELLVIKGGLIGGSVFQPDAVKKLAKLPPQEQMLAELAGLMQAPMSKMAAALSAPLNEMAGLLGAAQQQLAGLIRALADKGGAGEAGGGADAEAEAKTEAETDAQTDAETDADSESGDEPAAEAEASAEAESTDEETPAEADADEAEAEDKADES